MKRPLLVAVLLGLAAGVMSSPAAAQAGSNSLDDQLNSATMNGDTAALQQLLDKGANIEAKDMYGRTPLMRAAEHDWTEVVKLLLDKGANIEAKDHYGYTALTWAARSGRVDVVKLLLDKGANIEAKANHGGTALIVAAREGNIDVVKLLLDKGANIEAKDEDGWTPLLHAVQSRSREYRTDVVKLLLDRGANIEAKASTRPFEAWTALIFAVDQGNVDAIRQLLDRGANIEAKAIDGDTALIVAAQYGNIDVVKLLLNKGANIEAKGRLGSTALQLARIGTDAEVVQLLKQALSKDPRANFAEHLSNFQRNPSDDALREEVIKHALGLPALPAIPEEARQLFLQASALIKQTSTPKELEQPIELLRKALEIAPWWGNAYYNLSRALELSWHYDEAVKQLNYYLELNPSEADATEARARIAVIQTEKETAAQKKQANESVLAVKYVSGGIIRQHYSDVPAWWQESGSISSLYAYAVPEESPFYVNVFRMPNGYLLTISLLALSNNGTYTGDQIAVNAFNETKGGCNEGYMFAFGAHSYTDACGVHYDVSVSNQPNAIVTVTYTPTGASVTIPVVLLYRGRVLQVGWDSTGTVYQGSHDKGVEVLHFDGSVVQAARDPDVNAMGLTPTSVIPHKK